MQALKLDKPVSRQETKINTIRNHQTTIIIKPLSIAGDSDSDEGIIVVSEEIRERLRKFRSVLELEDKAHMADAELEERDRILGRVRAEVRAPLDVEANDEAAAAKAAVVDVLDVGDPGADELRHRCDGDFD